MGRGRIGDEKGARSSVGDVSRDCEGEDTGCIPKDAGSDVGESGSNQSSL